MTEVRCDCCRVLMDSSITPTTINFGSNVFTDLHGNNAWHFSIDLCSDCARAVRDFLRERMLAKTSSRKEASNG